MKASPWDSLCQSAGRFVTTQTLWQMKTKTVIMRPTLLVQLAQRAVGTDTKSKHSAILPSPSCRRDTRVALRGAAAFSLSQNKSRTAGHPPLERPGEQKKNPLPRLKPAGTGQGLVHLGFLGIFCWNFKEILCGDLILVFVGCDMHVSFVFFDCAFGFM